MGWYERPSGESRFPTGDGGGDAVGPGTLRVAVGEAGGFKVVIHDLPYRAERGELKFAYADWGFDLLDKLFAQLIIGGRRGLLRKTTVCLKCGAEGAASIRPVTLPAEVALRELPTMKTDVTGPGFRCVACGATQFDPGAAPEQNISDAIVNLLDTVSIRPG